MTDFLEISTHGYNPKPEKIYTDKFDNYIHLADETGKAVKCFIMTPLEFRKWYKYCIENDLDHTQYKEIPIVINHDEMKLSLLTMLIKDKDS